MSTTSLTALAVGDRAVVHSYSDPNAPYARQLLRLGLTPGTELTVARRAPLGDPIQIVFRGYSLALRPSEADALLLQTPAE